MCTSKFLVVVLNGGICISDEKIALSRFPIFQISGLRNLEIFYSPHHQPIQDINLKRIFQGRFSSSVFYSLKRRNVIFHTFMQVIYVTPKCLYIQNRNILDHLCKSITAHFRSVLVSLSDICEFYDKNCNLNGRKDQLRDVLEQLKSKRAFLWWG